MTSKTIAECLADIGIATEDFFDGCASIEDEFKLLKRYSFAKILETHPDKGGDAAEFRKVNDAWQTIRELKSKGLLTTSLTSHLNDNVSDAYTRFANQSGDDMPSYEYYYEAASQKTPGYRIELAKSGRSQCQACKKNAKKKRKISAQESECTTLATTEVATGGAFHIDKDAIRLGSMDSMSGTYGRWNHLNCWRVPYRVWAGLTNPTCSETVLEDLLAMDQVLLSGLTNLSEEQQMQFVRHVMQREHWAKKTKRSKAPPNVEEIKKSRKEMSVAAVAPEANSGNGPTETAVVGKGKVAFRIPLPGDEGAVPGCLDGQRFVLTGTFPELGGGQGLSLGKDKCKAMIESFGGKVTSGISGKTNYLVVGKEPGGCQLGEARHRGLTLIDTRGLQSIMLGSIPALEDAPKPTIGKLSAGYPGKRIAS